MPISIMSERKFVYCLLILASFISVAGGYAQTIEPGRKMWAFRTRAVVSGGSYESDPVDFKAYSGIAFETGIARTFGRHLAAEFSLRTESREIDREVASGPAERLGSLELLPFNVTLQYYPVHSERWHPYVGLGANLTVAWEKSGVLDSLDVEPSVGPVVQVGLDYDLNDVAFVNLDIRWNTLTTDIKCDGDRFAELKIDPLSLGLGVGFRF